jgi:hypothetical protein
MVALSRGETTKLSQTESNPTVKPFLQSTIN